MSSLVWAVNNHTTETASGSSGRFQKNRTSNYHTAPTFHASETNSSNVRPQALASAHLPWTFQVLTGISLGEEKRFENLRKSYGDEFPLQVATIVCANISWEEEFTKKKKKNLTISRFWTRALVDTHREHSSSTVESRNKKERKKKSGEIGSGIGAIW